MLSCFCWRITQDDLTNALCANLAVTIGTLAGEGTQCVNAILAGLTVMFISLTFIDICVCGWCDTICKKKKEVVIVSKQIFIQHDWKKQCDCSRADGGRLCSPHLHPTAENITSCWIMFAVSCRWTPRRCPPAPVAFSLQVRFCKTPQLSSCEILQIPTLSGCPP